MEWVTFVSWWIKTNNSIGKTFFFISNCFYELKIEIVIKENSKIFCLGGLCLCCIQLYSDWSFAEAFSQEMLKLSLKGRVLFLKNNPPAKSWDPWPNTFVRVFGKLPLNSMYFENKCLSTFWMFHLSCWISTVIPKQHFSNALTWFCILSAFTAWW